MADELYPQDREIVTRTEAIKRGLKTYFTGSPCKRGHFAYRSVAGRTCLGCLDRDAARRRASEYRRQNPEAVKAQNGRRDPQHLRQLAKSYYWKNVDKQRAKSRQRRRRAYTQNREAEIERSARYRANNLDKVNARLRDWSKNRRKTDAQFRLSGVVRRWTGRAVSAVRSSNSRLSSSTLLGCSIAELKRHLERMFHADMSWENYGTLWHVDHIKPLCSFDLTQEEEIRAACHFINLRPLLIEDNLRKGGNRALLL